MKDNKGQSVMEYVLLTSLIGIFCLVAIKQFGETVKTRIQKNEISYCKTCKNRMILESMLSLTYFFYFFFQMYSFMNSIEKKYFFFLKKKQQEVISFFYE
jgi:Flp pilus assembly pilin Flp